MATTSPLPATGRAAPVPSTLTERLERLVGRDVVPGTGAEDLSSPRGDEFGFGAIEALIGDRHPECLDPLRRQLGAKRVDRRNATAGVWRIATVVEQAHALGYDPCDATWDDAVAHLRWARRNGGRGGEPLAAGTCKTILNAIERLHRAGGRPSPFGEDGSADREEVKGMLEGWTKLDANATGLRAGAQGVAKTPTRPIIGYLPGTPVTIAHVARFNARAGGGPYRLVLREQARVLLIRETHAKPTQLRWVTLEDVRFGTRPRVLIPDRTDGGGTKRPFDISVELSRLLRVLRDDVRAAGASPGSALFQGQAGGPLSDWSGEAVTAGQDYALRRLLAAAAEQAARRGDGDVGPPGEVARFLKRLTYESVRDGLIVDCHAAGLNRVQVATFFGERHSMNEIDAIWNREEDKLRGGGRS